MYLEIFFYTYLIATLEYTMLQTPKKLFNFVHLFQIVLQTRIKQPYIVNNYDDEGYTVVRRKIKLYDYRKYASHKSIFTLKYIALSAHH